MVCGVAAALYATHRLQCWSELGMFENCVEGRIIGVGEFGLYGDNG